MNLSLEKLRERIGQTIEAFRNKLLPEAAIVCPNERDQKWLQEKLAGLERLYRESKDPPVFALRFLGDTQNGKSTLINVLLERKVLPEGRTGACSATIVRCRYKKQLGITIRFRYFSKEKFDADLAEAIEEAKIALTVEEESPEKKRENVCKSLSRFLRLFKIKEKTEDNAKLISLCRERGKSFEERHLLGTEEELTVTTKNEKQIRENLSARGRRAFIVDECVIEGSSFPEWHPQMELVDMPGTNASDPWHGEVKDRLKQKIRGLVIVTKETQVLNSVLVWFKETSILREVVGSSERNQTRVFIIKTFVDQLNLPEEEDSSKSTWEATKEYCQEIESYFREQIRGVVNRRYSAKNELDVLNAFIDGIPIHFVSPKVYRDFADKDLRELVQNYPQKNLKLAAAFEQFDQNPNNTGILDLRETLKAATGKFITSHYLDLLRLELEKEVGEIAHFFRRKRVVLEQRLANKGEFALQVVGQIEERLAPIFKQSQEEFEEGIVDIKHRFQEEVGQLLEQVAKEFSGKVQKKLDDWGHLHWASLRAAGRKNGCHTTYRGYEIDFNGQLADFCVEVLNSKWIDYRGKLRGFYDNLLRSFLPQLKETLAQVKGFNDEERQKLIEPTYEEMVASARAEVELQAERYDSETEEFDALRPELTKQIKEFLLPIYEKITLEIGRGSSYRMQDHLQKGLVASTHEIEPMIKGVVRKNWKGLTGAVENGITKLFSSWEKQFADQGVKLREIAERPSDGDDQRVRQLREIEKLVERWKGKQIV